MALSEETHCEEASSRYECMVAERNRRARCCCSAPRGTRRRAKGAAGGGVSIAGCARLRRRRAYKATAASQAQQFTSMYKTVRHGENSLQYTILPQQEGGLEAAATFSTGRKESSGCGRSAVLVAICVVLVGGVVAAVVVPFLVSSQVVVHYHRLRGPAPSPAPTLNISADSDDDDVTVRLTFEATSPTPPVEASSAAPTEVSTAVDAASTSAAPAPAAAGNSVTPEETATDAASTVSTLRTTTTTMESTVTTASTTTTQRRLRTTPPPPTATSTPKPHGKSWLPSKWPFVDPASTYAQWTVSTLCTFYQSIRSVQKQLFSIEIPITIKNNGLFITFNVLTVIYED